MRAWIGAAVLGVAIVVVAIVGASLAADQVQDDRFAFADIPEASLFYPGSVVLKDIKDARFNFAGRNIRLGTDAPFQDVQAFYERAYAGRPGWVIDGSSSRGIGTDEVQVCGWHNAEVTVRIGFWDVDDWLERYPGERRWATVYDIAIIEKSEDFTLPSPCLDVDH